VAKHVDHWVGEYWNAMEKGWVLPIVDLRADQAFVHRSITQTKFIVRFMVQYNFGNLLTVE
jgi:hypothetical protein